MAPELMNEHPYDYRADIWSLGCIIYETLAGEPPFCTTSLRTLYLLIQHENVKWPTFLTDVCFSFLKVTQKFFVFFFILFQSTKSQSLIRFLRRAYFKKYHHPE